MNPNLSVLMDKNRSGLKDVPNLLQKQPANPAARSKGDQLRIAAEPVVLTALVVLAMSFSFAMAISPATEVVLGPRTNNVPCAVPCEPYKFPCLCGKHSVPRVPLPQLWCPPPDDEFTATLAALRERVHLLPASPSPPPSPPPPSSSPPTPPPSSSPPTPTPPPTPPPTSLPLIHAAFRLACQALGIGQIAEHALGPEWSFVLRSTARAFFSVSWQRRPFKRCRSSVQTCVPTASAGVQTDGETGGEEPEMPQWLVDAGRLVAERLPVAETDI